MAEETKIDGVVSEEKTRRSAIKTAAQVAITAPAVGLLLSAGSKTASAQTAYQSDLDVDDQGPRCIDDCNDDGPAPDADTDVGD